MGDLPLHLSPHAYSFIPLWLLVQHLWLQQLLLLALLVHVTPAATIDATAPDAAAYLPLLTHLPALLSNLHCWCCSFMSLQLPLQYTHPHWVAPLFDCHCWCCKFSCSCCCCCCCCCRVLPKAGPGPLDTPREGFEGGALCPRSPGANP